MSTWMFKIRGTTLGCVYKAGGRCSVCMSMGTWVWLRHCVHGHAKEYAIGGEGLQATVVLPLSSSSPSAPSSLRQHIKVWEKWYLTSNFIINSSVFYCRNISHNEPSLRWCRFGVSLSLEVLHNSALINGDLLQIALQSW